VEGVGGRERERERESAHVRVKKKGKHTKKKKLWLGSAEREKKKGEDGSGLGKESVVRRGLFVKQKKNKHVDTKRWKHTRKKKATQRAGCAVQSLARWDGEGRSGPDDANSQRALSLSLSLSLLRTLASPRLPSTSSRAAPLLCLPDRFTNGDRADVLLAFFFCRSSPRAHACRGRWR